MGESKGSKPRHKHALYTFRLCFSVALRPRKKGERERKKKKRGLLGKGAQDCHLDFHAAPELCFCHCSVLLYVHRNLRTVRNGPFLNVRPYTTAGGGITYSWFGRDMSSLEIKNRRQYPLLAPSVRCSQMV